MPGLLDPPQKRVTYRAGLLPYAEYEDGSAGFAAPQSWLDTGHSLAKMGNAFQSMFGAQFAPQDAIPDQRDAGIAGLAMTGGGFGSLASKAVSGRALEDVAASNVLRSSPVEAGSKLRLAPQDWEPGQAHNIYDIYRGDQRLGHVNFQVNGDTATVHNISVGEPNALGVDGVRALRESFRDIHPDVVHFEGWRTSGARNGPAAVKKDIDWQALENDPNYDPWADQVNQRVTLFSNAPEAAAAGLLPTGGNDDRRGLLGALAGQQMARASYDAAPPPSTHLPGMGPQMHGTPDAYREEMDIPPEWWLNPKPGRKNPVGGPMGPRFNLWGPDFDLLTPAPPGS